MLKQTDFEKGGQFLKKSSDRRIWKGFIWNGKGSFEIKRAHLEISKIRRVHLKISKFERVYLERPKTLTLKFT